MRHILVEKHSKALEILEILNSGVYFRKSSYPPDHRVTNRSLSGQMTFNEAARQFSIDKAGRSGLLGWKRKNELDQVRPPQQHTWSECRRVKACITPTRQLRELRAPLRRRTFGWRLSPRRTGSTRRNQSARSTATTSSVWRPASDRRRARRRRASRLATTTETRRCRRRRHRRQRRHRRRRRQRRAPSRLC